MENRAMRKHYGFWAAKMVAVVLLLIASVAQAQQPRYYPTLSLTNSRAYPDQNILVPGPLPGGERYFLVPVFIYNEVDPNLNPNVGGQRLEPIRSFEFQVEYFNQAIELDENPAHGPAVVTVGPSMDNASEPALAEHFYIEYTDQPDPGNPSDTNSKPFNPFRRRIRIAAASEIPLPMANNPDTSQNVLLYLRFRVIPNVVNASQLQLDTSRFNDHAGDSLINSYADDPFLFRRGNFGGYQQFELRGRGLVRITPQPSIELRPLSLIRTEDNLNYEFIPELIFDPSVAAGQNPERSLQLRNGQGQTRLTNVSVCSDQPWLKISENPGGGEQCIFIPRIDYTGAVGSEEKNLWISADPGGLQPGIYYGYITITSDGALNSPTRILVKFVYRRSPDEPGVGQNTGIRLSVTNSCNQSCSSGLVFGVGQGATSGIDPLFGETIFTADDRLARDTHVVSSSRCYAYFEPLDRNVDIQFGDPNNLGILRDVRSNVESGTQLYKVVFSAGDPVCYPVTVCVNPADFPAGGRIIARDILNGSQFSVNLREATQTGDQRCFTIRDTRINSFIIEYTPGTVGVVPALIANGWNLLSLPVVPPNNDAEVIFPDAAGTPFEYNAAAAWVPREELEFGHGYMVKFGDNIGFNNRNVAGVRQEEVNGVRVFRGWNTVGSISRPTTYNGIFFTPLAGSSDVPRLESGVWEYVTGRGYQEVSYMLPGKGYFIKVSADGFFGLRYEALKSIAEDITPKLAKIEVRDAAQSGQDLFFGNVQTEASPSRYEMPPTVFGLDARFSLNRGYVAFNENSYTVNLKTKNYPVALNFNNLQGEVEVRDMQGNVIATATNGGSVVIENSKINQVEIAYKGSSNGRVNTMGFGLEKSTPNPFTTATTINYSIPAEMHVSLVVHNQLGQVVRTLVNEVKGAGTHPVTFEGSELPAGTYFYTITAGSYTRTEKVVLNK